MTNALLILLVILISASGNVFKKIYNKKNGNNGTFIFNALVSVSAALFFILSSGGNIHFNFDFLPYSVAFAISYCAASVGAFIAIREGSLALSALISSYSLFIPTIYGLVFLKESTGNFFYIGIALLVISLFLLNIKKDDCKVTKKWFIAIVISFIGNGMCSTFQKMEQLAFNGNYKSEFMIVALVICAVVCFFIALIKEKNYIKPCIAKAGWTAILSGIVSGIVNLLVMVLTGTGTIPTSLFFPLISAGGIITSFCLSVFAYRERFSRIQLIGFIAGVISVAFLNM